MRRVGVGFSEWDSNCYYDEDFTPLLNLADFAQDREVATRAAMILDMAVDSFRGTYGTSHGRSYPGHVLSGRGEATSGVQKIAWGMGTFNSPNRMTAVCLATSRRYRVPETIEALAQDMPEELVNRERQSFNLEDAEPFGIRADDLEAAMPIWGAGQFANRRTAEETFRLADRVGSGCFNTIIRPYVEAVLGTYRELDAQGIDHDGDLDRRTLSEVNKVTFRTPDYPLSCAQDYRKGKPGFQQHIWQATLGPDAVDGPFGEWGERIVSAALEFGDLCVRYRAPGLGEVRFSWEDALTVDGEGVPLRGYPRFENPYCCAEYGSGRYEIAYAGYRHDLDFEKSVATFPRRC